MPWPTPLVVDLPSVVRDDGAVILASRALLALMVAQASLGLLRPDLYRDAGSTRATWFGNDLVTLLVAAPLLAVALRGERAGSTRARHLRVGVLGYAAYNYAFYLLGAAINAWFPLYVAAVVLAAGALHATLHAAAAADDALPARAVRRGVGGYLVVVATGLAVVWLGMWAVHVFAGRPAPGGPEVFRLVAALDLSLIVPALALGGVSLWRGTARSLAIAATAVVQAALYLLVLSVNAVLLGRQGLASPGELLTWAPLALCTGAAAIVLLAAPLSPRRDGVLAAAGD